MSFPCISVNSVVEKTSHSHVVLLRPWSVGLRPPEGDMRIIHVITRLILGGAQENTLLTVEGLTPTTLATM